ncbi:MAG: hypothetical protein ACI8Z9_001741 [Paraglaciecola sp.]|jgi:hypothetical protein
MISASALILTLCPGARVPGWPVTEIIPVDGFLYAICVRRHELSTQDEAPVWAMTQSPSSP